SRHDLAGVGIEVANEAQRSSHRGKFVLEIADGGIEFIDGWDDGCCRRCQRRDRGTELRAQASTVDRENGIRPGIDLCRACRMDAEWCERRAVAADRRIGGYASKSGKRSGNPCRAVIDLRACARPPDVAGYGWRWCGRAGRATIASDGRPCRAIPDRQYVRA